MSTLFSPEVNEHPEGYIVFCCPRAKATALGQSWYRTYEEAKHAWATLRVTRQPLAGCNQPEECPETGLYFINGVDNDTETEDLFVNTSVGNTPPVLEALGIEVPENDEPNGVLDAKDFLGRVLVARGLLPEDAGRPSEALPGPGARVIDCGRRPGYVEDKLEELQSLAEWCVEHDRAVQWG